MDQLSPDLHQLLLTHTPAGTVLHTLAANKPNRVVEIRADGVRIGTDRSGAESPLVPAWMIQRAWEHLRDHGALTNSELLASEGLNVKRSSAV